MGKLKKKFNWKSREVVKTRIDKSEEKKIVLDLKSDGRYDESNPLVLPSKKRKTIVEKPKHHNVPLLSKKKRKLLEKVIEKKNKKENRAQLIEELSKVQATADDLNKLVSISTVQTKGLKRRCNEIESIEENDLQIPDSALESTGNELIVRNSIKGAFKRRRLLAAFHNLDKTSKPKERDLNVVGFEISSDEEDSDNENTNDDHESSEIKIKEEVIDVKGTSESAPINDDIPNLDISLEAEKESGVTSNSQNDTVNLIQNENVPEDKCENKSTTKKQPKIKKIKEEVPRTPAVYVLVERKPEIQEARLKLPILAEEQAIMELINAHPVVIIAGETGSGKTTQVPQFLYEAGYTKDGKMIGITEPRRVAAISMAKRVGEELNLGENEVSYLIRFEGNVTPETKIKFMTDGVLLKEMKTDFELSKYSVIILDEAHERSVFTDILMGLLSRVVILRQKMNNPLKLIIMSATLRLGDFTENRNLFRKIPPVIKVESRQFEVTVHFNKRTNPDYVREAYRKACKIHTQLPDGGILIFVTGQQEVNSLVSKLKKAFPLRKWDNKDFQKRNLKNKERDKDLENNENEHEDVDDPEAELNLDYAMHKIKNKKKQEKQIILPKVKLDDFNIAPNDYMELDLLASDEESDNEDWEEEVRPVNSQPLWVLPLYSVLSSKEQAKVFDPPPEGCRVCIVATNVAETSLTIPGIKYVVDSGKVKTKLYDKVTGVSKFEVTWASKAAANQRAGRAGRTSAGHCYRLYSSAVFNDEFEGWASPEILRKPIDDLVLQMKSLGIHKVLHFPFPSAPEIEQLKIAEKRLTHLGALERVDKQKNDKGDNWIGKITPLGEAMAQFPVSPRFAKMLCLSHQHNLAEYSVALVAALSVPELILNTQEGDKGKNRRMSWAGIGNFKLLGDAMVLLRCIGYAEYEYSRGKLDEFCKDNNIRLKGIIEARKIRLQITKEINLINPDLNLTVNPKMQPPSDIQAKLLRQIILSGMIDQVARKIDVPDEESATTVKTRPLYHTGLLSDTVQIHASSVLYKDYPEWIVYQDIYETNKIYLRGITAIEPEWLPVFAPQMCRLGRPLEDPSPFYDSTNHSLNAFRSGHFGKRGWKLPVIKTEFPPGLDKYKWFGRFFLDGTIFPSLKKFLKDLKHTPTTMIRSWSRLQPCTEYFLKTLVSKEVDSRQKLLEVWEEDKTYLLEAYYQWLPESLHNEAAIMWPPIGP